MSEYINEEIKKARKRFEKHSAKVVLKIPELTIIDWANGDSSNNAIRYILDTQKGNLIITGDLGDAVFSWYHKESVANLVKYTKDLTYLVEKAQTASDLYTFEKEDIEEDLIKACHDAIDDQEKDWEEAQQSQLDDIISYLDDELYHVSDKDIYFDSQIRDLFEEFDSSWYENSAFYRAGRRISPFVICWSEGLQMAFEQVKGDICNAD